MNTPKTRLFDVKVGDEFVTIKEIPTGGPIFGLAGVFVTLGGLAALSAWLMAAFTFVPAVLALYATQFPLFGLLLLIGSLLLLITREGRRSVGSIVLMAVISVLLLPLAFVSAWAANSEFDIWGQIASLPLVSGYALVIMVVAAVKRAWPAVLAGLVLLIVSGLPYLFTLGRTDVLTGSQMLMFDTAMGYDNVVALLSFLVLSGIVGILIRRSARNRQEAALRRQARPEPYAPMGTHPGPAPGQRQPYQGPPYQGPPYQGPPHQGPPPQY